ncbi:SIR2 family protein [Magnetofaba australis]|uniref:Uncharacterized protein n=1 Tax=Magnetofaba australis IT-1 TaxID=1434232 RepID=A0A1Y2K7P2_9PROT|nr:tetratricopeptide repeat protein [Magnetofaba australis]OSM06248.1 hypothetical protein MAIT1_01233 [Magnetofaba australis IT-1]
MALHDDMILFISATYYHALWRMTPCPTYSDFAMSDDAAAPPKPLKPLPAYRFAQRLKRDLERDTECRYAFFLGAGCSISSGIPAAGALSKRWLQEYQKEAAPNLKAAEFDAWAAKAFPQYDKHNVGALYGELIKEMYSSPRQRQKEIERICANRYPSYGYSVLAALMARDQACNVALTTNFDDLLIDALYLFTDKKPLVILDDSMAAHIRASYVQPLVVKLHGDHKLTPMNTATETNCLNPQMEEKAQQLLTNRGMVFLGYGGNDASILKMLQGLGNEPLAYPVYWLSGTEPTGVIRPWLDAVGAFWVQERDFDAAMLLLQEELDLPKPDRKRFDHVFDNVFDQYKALSKKANEEASQAPDDAAKSAMAEAVKKTDKKFESWRQVLLKADRLKKSDPDAADAIYLQGITDFPNDANILGDYALFLETIRNDSDKAEQFYLRAIDADPNHANNLVNYAVFLENIRNDSDKAEQFYLRAIDADPKRANTLGNYANFLTDIRHDHEQAEAFYLRAIDADPKHVNTLGNYAVFLKNIRHDHEQAEAFYLRAIDADPNHANNLGNYALFLENIRNDSDKAEQFYLRAIDADPKHATALGNYAVFLTDIRHDHEQAETFFLRAIDADPKYATALGNYAAFLKNIRHDHEQAEAFYLRAIDADPKHASNLGNYANFLTDIRHDHEQAEDFYRRAIDANPNHANNLGNYANFLTNIRHDHEQAEAFYLRAIDADPKYANNLGNYAEFLLLHKEQTEAGLAQLEQLIQQSGLKEEYWLIYWCLRFVFAPQSEQGKALSSLKQLLGNPSLRDPGWNFHQIVQKGQELPHPKAEWLQPLADVINDKAPLESLDAWPEWKALEREPNPDA